MSDEKLYKLRLTKPVKLGEYWKDPGMTVKVDKKIAAEIVLNKAGEFTDPDESIDTRTLKNIVKDGTSNGEEINRATIVSELCEIEGVSTEVAENLIDAGFLSVQDVAEANEEDLVKIKGIGKKSAPKIVESAEEIVEATSDDE